MNEKGLNLELPAELTLFTVDDFRDEVMTEIGDKKIDSLDAANLRLLDGSGVQLLLSLHKTFPYLGLENPSTDLIQNLELMGVKEILIRDGSVDNG